MQADRLESAPVWTSTLRTNAIPFLKTIIQPRAKFEWEKKKLREKRVLLLASITAKQNRDTSVYFMFQQAYTVAYTDPRT